MFVPVWIRAEIRIFFFSCKGPDCKYFRLCRSYSLCSNSALSLFHESRHRLLYLCFKINLFTKIGCWLDYPKGHNLSTETLQVFIFWLVGCIFFVFYFWVLFLLSFFLLSLLLSGFPGGSDGEESPCNAGDLGSIPGLGRSPWKRGCNALQYSGPENSMDYIVHGVTKSQTRLSHFHFHFAIISVIFLKTIISKPLLLVYTNAINFISWSCVCPACSLILLVFLGRFDIIYR